MTKQQRYQYDMLVRVRGFGNKYPQLFREGSKGPQFLAAVAAALASIDQSEKDRLVGKIESGRVKATIRRAVYGAMQNLAVAARRVMRLESSKSLYKLPRHRNLRTELATARLFLDKALPREAEFVTFGLPPTFMTEFKTLVNDFEAAVDAQQQAKNLRRQARSGAVAAIRKGIDAVRDLDAIVRTAASDDQTAIDTWLTARRIEGQRTYPRAAKPTPVELVAPSAPGTAASQVTEAGVAVPAVAAPSTSTASVAKSDDVKSEESLEKAS